MNGEESEKRASQLAPIDKDHEEVLNRLPTHQRNSILMQYDLPAINVSIFTILGYATYFERALQLIGLLMAFGAGIAFCTLY
jgi:hypothetical protein